MSYQANPAEDYRIRQRIRQILNEKIADRTYDGEAFVGGMSYDGEAFVGGRKYQESQRVRRDRAERKKYNMLGGAKKRLSPQLENLLKSECYRIKNPNRVQAGKKASKKNPWIQFYKDWVRKHPNMSGKEASKMASKEYKQSKPKSIPKRKRGRPKKIREPIGSGMYEYY
jgi:hypothetical protein